MNKARLDITVSKLVGNNGQLDWLPKNPRQWTAVDVERTKRSIDRDPDFLEDRPLLVVPAESGKGERYIVFAGNLRLKACKDNGVKTAPAVIYFPESDEDRETVKRRAMLDNGSFGSWDYDELANNWDDLDLVELGIPAWEGQAEIPGIEENTAEDDNFIEEDEEIHVVCKLGDVWQLGDHRLMCGDSISLEEVQKLVGGGSVSVLLTDPPYNVDYESAQGDKIMNDNMSDAEFRKFIEASFRTADAVMQPGAVFYVWHADSNGLTFRAAAEAVGWKVRQCLIWNKNHFVLGRQDYQWKHEPCLYGWKDGAGHYFFDSRSESTVLEDEPVDLKKMHKAELLKLLEGVFAEKRATTVIDCDKPLADADHPTMKPVKLIGYLMRNSTKRGDTVLDLFGGSGSTLIAAEQLGRKCYMMELDPHYCDVIIARWEKLTGRKAEKLN